MTETTTTIQVQKITYDILKGLKRQFAAHSLDSVITQLYREWLLCQQQTVKTQ